MFYIVLLFAAAALVGGGRSSNVNRHMKLLELDNNLLNLQSRQASKKFLAIIDKPKPVIVHTNGAPLELNCEAVGTPAPSIHWFKNDAPVYEYDLESNEIIDTNPTSLGRVSSTLLVRAASGAGGARGAGVTEYSCLAVAGLNTLRASTKVYNSNGSTDLSERSKLLPFAPQILVTYKVLADCIGCSVALPCRARGHPRPKITWRDSTGRLVGNDPRMKVLRSGELVISSLRWTDLGEFTCRATNMFGSTLSTTFVYPARPE
ncbi:PREDICTED: neural/ectodermal development factor IMP-L2 [Papilio polytes]|uniref:neural/ectodermal development factor IMP-L2 n=1 Tax=Papilio polytes TaxID=76194 RepID=UPI000675CD16|nr:PREDICTED: neural/ectodermal development factor IMP-L2 [Papilio polytes]XP_013134137.1 PREDICTED: neural/ectodermal development factor IMP-L2 [Papilio polytes]XP_013134146.1 PREDICTED: neural/ectodermal development factor IMP-L2 [Papilio polytes]